MHKATFLIKFTYEAEATVGATDIGAAKKGLEAEVMRGVSISVALQSLGLGRMHAEAVLKESLVVPNIVSPNGAQLRAVK